MNPRWHRVLTRVFLAANPLFWLPGGAHQPDLAEVVGRRRDSQHGRLRPIERRCSHRGARHVRRVADGNWIFALLEAFRPRHRDSPLLFFLLALTGLAACRLAGMIVEGESTYLSFGTTIAPGKYNQVGLAMYELPNMILAWALFLLRPRHEPDAARQLPQHRT